MKDLSYVVHTRAVKQPNTQSTTIKITTKWANCWYLHHVLESSRLHYQANKIYLELFFFNFDIHLLPYHDQTFLKLIKSPPLVRTLLPRGINIDSANIRRINVHLMFRALGLLQGNSTCFDDSLPLIFYFLSTNSFLRESFPNVYFESFLIPKDWFLPLWFKL